jgi:hypothetical protein
MSNNSRQYTQAEGADIRERRFDEMEQIMLELLEMYDSDSPDLDAVLFEMLDEIDAKLADIKASFDCVTSWP